MQATTAKRPEVKEDVWVPTVCDMCWALCNVLVHRVNGVVVKIEGNPEGPFDNRRLCAKGFAGLMGLYDPSRVTRPLKRTNPEKGFGIDPGWQQISWEEALNLVSEKLKKIRDDDPRKLLISAGSNNTSGAGEFLEGIWGPAFGTPNTHWQGYFCGNYLHSSMYQTNGTFHSDYDIENCNYLILEGNQSGFMAGINPNIMAQKMAEARTRGMKVVSVDPILTNAGGKADEWIPIRPGTDGAWVNSLINVLVNELGIYDAEFIKKKTNGPYLVGPDGHYVKEGSKPLIWDIVDNVAKPFDADVKDYALDGVYAVRGLECRPAFHYFKENAKNYTPEKVSEITTIPADTIRRIAREFGEAARIGETIVVEGHELPYRPVAMNIYRGAGAHNHGVYTALAVQALNMVVGAFYAVGGHRGTNLVGPGESWKPRMSSDGMVMPHATAGHGVDYYDFEVAPPTTLALEEIVPISTNRSAAIGVTMGDPDQFKIPYRAEVVMVTRHNQLMTSAEPKKTAEALKKAFVIYFTTHKDELAELSDVLLPDQHCLERTDIFLGTGGHSISAATGQFYRSIRQPVVEPAGEARNHMEVLMDLADRVGILPEIYDLMNVRYRLKDPYKLDRTKKYSPVEIYDRRAKAIYDPDMGLDWFKKHGVHRIKRSVEERYPGAFLPHRFPIYFENMLRAGKAIRSVVDELGIKWDTDDYKPVLHWRPCSAFSMEPRDEFYVVNYKPAFHTISYTIQNPWLNELGRYHPYVYKILMNTEAAKKRGIKDSDTIRVESEAGSVVGKVKLTEGVHPEVLGIAGCFANMADGRPVAKGTGVHFNTLVPLKRERLDPVSGGLDSCVRVKVTKVKD